MRKVILTLDFFILFILPTLCSAQFGNSKDNPDDIYWDNIIPQFHGLSPVFALTVYDSNLVVASNRDNGAGVVTHEISMWDGSSWIVLDSAMDNRVLSLTVYNNLLIVGGFFSSIGGIQANKIASWDGSTWSALGSGINGLVMALCVYDGKLIAGGYFDSAGNVEANNIASWDGSTWSALGSGINGGVTALDVYNGKLIAGGCFDSAGNVEANNIASWDNSTWSALGSGLIDIEYGGGAVDALLEYQGNLIASGWFTTSGDIEVNKIASWNGSAWSPLGSGLDYYGASALTIYNGNLIAGGGFRYAGGISAKCVASWDGSSWSSLGSGLGGAEWGVYTLAVYKDKLYAGGDFISPEYIASWDGTSWFSVNGFAGSVRHLTTYQGNLVVAGNFGIATLLDDKSWHVFSPMEEAMTLAVYGDSLFAGGPFYVASWDGFSWSNLEQGQGTSFGGFVYDLIKYNCQLIAGGSFDYVGSSLFNNIATWNGLSWQPLGAGFSRKYGANLNAFTIFDGKLMVGGLFDSADNIEANNIASWDGLAWFPLGSGIDGEVHALTNYDGKLIAGGSFAIAGGIESNNIALWDGSVWLPLGSGVNGGVFALTEYDGNLIVGGGFDSAGSISANNIASWDGSSWSALGSGVNGTVYALTEHNGSLFVGGTYFSDYIGFGTYLGRWTKRNGPPTVSVLSPNGCEQWAIDGNRTIRWSPGGSYAEVSIDISRDDGSTWSNLTNYLSSNSSSWPWIVSGPITNNAKIRVTLSGPNGSVTDMSDVCFTICEPNPPTVTITSPNGGEEWAIGSDQTISWSPRGQYTAVAIDITRDNGYTWSNLNTYSSNNSTSCPWTVTGPITSNAKIRVSLSGPEGSVSDISDATFTIRESNPPMVTVVSPNGGEQWPIGSVRAITWLPGGLYDTVSIDISRDNGSTWSPLTCYSSNNSSSWQWQVMGPITANAKIRVTLYGPDGTASDISNADFEIVNPQLPCVYLTDQLSICADDILEGPSNFFTLQGNVIINDIVRLSGTITADKRSGLVHPEIKGYGQIKVIDIQGQDYVIYNRSNQYVMYATDDELVCYNRQSMLEAYFDVFGFGARIGRLTFGSAGDFVTAEFGVNFPYPIDKVMENLSSEFGNNFYGYLNQISWGRTYSRISGISTLGDIGPFGLNFGFFALNDLHLYWDESEKRIGGGMTIMIPGISSEDNKGNQYTGDDVYFNVVDSALLDIPTKLIDKSGKTVGILTLGEVINAASLSELSFLEGIGIEIEFVSGRINSFSVYLATTIPLGTTGLRITEMTGALSNIQSNFTISASVDIQTMLPDLPVMGAPITIDDLGVRIKPVSYFRGEGTLQIFSYDLAKAYLEYLRQAGPNILRGGGYVNLGGYFTGTNNWSLRSNYASGTGSMSVQIPPNPPIFLWPIRNQKLASVDISMKNFTDWRAQIEKRIPIIGRISIACKLLFNSVAPYMHLFLGTNFNKLHQIFKRSTNRGQIIEFVVPDNTPQILISASSNFDLFDFTMTSPSGVIHDSSNTDYGHYDSSFIAVMSVVSPESGIWQFRTDYNGDMEFEAVALNQMPTLSIETPDNLGHTMPEISLHFADFCDTIAVELYYDNDCTGFDGSFITGFDVINSASVNLDWNTYNVPDGEYYMYCVADDGQNAPVKAYSKGTILIEHQSIVESPENLTVEQIGDSVFASWDEPTDTSISLSVLFVENQLNGHQVPYAVLDSTHCYITDLSLGCEYFVWAIFRDSLGNESERSDTIVLNLASQLANNAPYFNISQDSNWHFIVDETGRFKLNAVDADGGQLNYSVISPPVGLFISDDSVFWTPTDSQTGHYYLEFIVSDLEGASDSVFKEFVVLTKEQYDANISFSSLHLYEGDNKFVRVENGRETDSIAVVTVTNLHSSSQVELHCLRQVDWTFIGRFELSASQSTIFPVIHGDTIQACYTFDDSIYCTTAIYDTTSQPTDITPPSSVSDMQFVRLTNDSILITWTVPGDDGKTGHAAFYDLRFSFDPILSESEYLSATKYTNIIYPDVPGATDSVTYKWSDLEGYSGQQFVYFALKISDELYNYSPLSNILEISSYVCGDANGNGAINTIDVTYIIAFLYKGGPDPNPVQSADVNGNGTTNIIDVTYLIAYLYKGGPELNCK